MRIFLTGMPGSGKTYWMQQVATMLQYRAVDMDHYITEQAQSSIAALFALGEAHFREKERAALQDIIRKYKSHVVIATGGGAPCYKDNLQLMQEAGCMIYLETPLEVLLANVQQPGVHRPLLENGTGMATAEKLSALYRERKEIYEQAPIKIDAVSATLATFAEAINTFLSRPQNPFQ